MAYQEQTGGAAAAAPPPTSSSRTKYVPKPTGDPRNPYGLGDPDDNSLRKVELEIMIPMKMRDRAKEEKCVPQVQAFTECCKEAGVAMVLKCRSENDKLKTCLGEWYNNAEFKQECTDMYLRERAQYRRTGIKQKDMKKYVV